MPMPPLISTLFNPMLIDRDMNTVFAELAAGARIAYLLHLHVQPGRVRFPFPDGRTISVAPGPTFDDRLIRTAVRDQMLLLPATAIGPRPSGIRWQMPGATATCNVFYVTEADVAPLTQSSASASATADSDMHMHMEVQEMARRIEQRIQAHLPDLGTEWRLVYMLTKLVPDSANANAEQRDPAPAHAPAVYSCDFNADELRLFAVA